MGITATNQSSTDFKQPTPGTHLARLYQIVDIGTQHDEYLGEPTIRRQAIFRWELPLETEVLDGVTKPLIVSKFYTLSTSEKSNLRKDMQSWLSRTFSEAEANKFDVTSMIDQYCMLSISLTDKGKSKVVAVSAVPKGFAAPPPPFNPAGFFSMDSWSQSAFDLLPKGFQDIIKKSDEYRVIHDPDFQRGLTPAPRGLPPKQPAPSTRKANVDDLDDDIPF